MILLSSIIGTFKNRFLARYKNHLLPSHVRALEALQNCRQETSPHMLARCTNDNCQTRSLIPHSCGHRNCPHCQNHENWQWIENQLEKQLPAQYFLITFTLPRELRQLAFNNQKTIYSLMFLCIQDLLKTFALNDKHLRGMAGFTTVLHTHSRRLELHPHIHVVMPAASINEKTRAWRVKRESISSITRTWQKFSGPNYLKKSWITGYACRKIVRKSGSLTAKMLVMAARP